MENKRFCRACELLQQMMSDVANIQSYMDAIAPEDRASDDEQTRRLEICKTCQHRLVDGTCFACGCYIALRTLPKHSACPKKKW